MDWDDLRYFLALARAGTLVRAARQLGVKHTTVGRRLAALERALGARLFTRGPAGVQLTRAGREVLSNAQQIAEHAADIERRAAGVDGRVVGGVRLTVPQSVDGYLMRELAGLCSRHPELRLEIVSDDRALDLRRGEAELALRFGDVDEPTLITRKIAAAGWVLYASAEYVARRGHPSTQGQLEGHDVVGFDERLADTVGARWLRAHGSRARVTLRGSGVAAVARAAAVGFGLAPLPCFIARSEPELQPLTPGLIGSRDISLVVHPDLVATARVRATMDFLIDLFARDATVWSGAYVGDAPDRFSGHPTRHEGSCWCPDT